MRQTNLRCGIALFCLLLGMGLFVYTGMPDSADGEAMLAVAASLWRTGMPTVNQVSHTDAIFPVDSARMGAFGVDGALYSKKGITPSLALLPLVAAADAAPWLSTRAAAMLLNPIITAITGLALYMFAIWLGYSAAEAFVTALLYGLATLALPYAATLYGEPLAGLLLLASVMGIYRSAAGIGKRPYLPLAGAGLSVGLLVGVNNAYFIIAAVLGIAALIVCWRNRRLLDITAFALPLALCLLGYGLYNAARFGSPLETGYRFGDGEGFNSPFLMGIYGLTISPYRGIFWYSPILLLALPGWLLLRKRTRGIAWLILALVMAQIALFAAWWSWDGGITWGTRFLLPVVPLACLALAPVVSWARRKPLILVILIGFAALSLFVQLLGALFSPIPFTAYLANVFGGGDLVHWRTEILPSQLGSVSQSAVAGHLALLLAGWEITPAWASGGFDPLALLASIGLIAAGVAIAALPRLSRPWRIALALAAVLLAVNIAAGRQSDQPNEAPLRELAGVLAPDGAVFAETSLFGSGLLDLEHRRDTLVVNAPTVPDDRDSRPLFEYALRVDERLWLLTWYGAADPAHWAERELFERSAFAGETFAAGHRALLFDLRPVDAQPVTGGWRFGAVSLDSYAAQIFYDGVSVILNWSVSEIPEQPASWFVHLLNPEGAIASQQDRQPQGGFSPITVWESETIVTDRLFLPATGVGEGWALRIGWVDPQTGERLTAYAPDGSDTADGFIVIPLSENRN